MINPTAEPDRFFTTDEVAEYFSVNRRTIVNWIEEGRLDAVKPSRRYLVSGQAILQKVKRSKEEVY